ncbi:PhoH family protein [Thermosipho melanesiensis]|uniref:PhoH family protein n=2 Tax=Thermosipho melanesiensis TaxID=46541 RepID=A6LK95_THEM4|nr:PhoH family protein [Thermosipho melanesiensis]ABR30346.1 PhoH family protein [Thermosipho melanesiensis BI429]APT73512.1 PhoH family protein [Thermosipho melanesiensis]OOC37462.1 PhoH family protein [Thermosipho melanesiensis]OOC39667.1 PhoH family protein [Thermosipho melanesiensis]OOC39695.1 PhoH family protein [Thermosipho melanesiensis]
MLKNFVLDTNVLIHDPESIYSFEDNAVIIPLPVLEELDNLKRHTGSLGKYARQAIREFDKLRQKGKLSEGVKLENGGLLKVIHLKKNEHENIDFLFEKYIDNWILVYTLHIMKNSKEPTYLVSKDINLRVKADALGIPAQDYLTDRSELATLNPGYFEFRNVDMVDKEMLYPNIYIDSIGTYYRFNGRDLLQISKKIEAWNVKPRNREQFFAMDALLNDDIKLVSLIGIAGTGKTFITLACALQKAVTEQKYEKIVIARPLVAMGGKDIGYLPGSYEEKMKPWMSPIYDNLEYLFRLSNVNMKEFMKKGIIEIEALTYIRGRSIPDQFIIIDEAQNLTPHEIKTVLTRAGENTKIVLLGDPYQIDTPYLDKDSNGLVYAASRFLESNLSAHIVLKKGERSMLATEAANLL